MTKSISKREFAILKKLAIEAHEAELEGALMELLEKFMLWSGDGIDSFELSDRIHEFHNGISRELYKTYVYGPPELAVATGIARHVLSSEEIDAGLYKKISGIVDLIRKHRDTEIRNDVAQKSSRSTALPAPVSEVIPFPSKSHKIVTLKVTLSESTPLIWRRIEVPSSLSLADMHFVIQIIMGWEDCHMHCFTVGKRTYSIPLEDGDNGPGIENSLDFTLDSLGLLKPGTKFSYIYDFGDNWKHEILVESVSEQVKGNLYPRCIKAVRACPPEDCGGPYGYKRMLQILKKKNHPEHDEIMEYLGENFDPNFVDIDEINMYLA